MKKVITSIAIALLTSSVMSIPLRAQDYAFSTMPIKKTFIQPAVLSEDTSVTLESIRANLANSSSKSVKEVKKAARDLKHFNRLLKNFESEFKGASNVTWDKHQGGYTGVFTKDGLKHMACYNKDGNLINSMITYPEKWLDADIRKIVMNAYKDYKINLVNEVHQDGITVYLVTIENEKNIKLVTVCEGVLNIYKEYKKAS